MMHKATPFVQYRSTTYEIVDKWFHGCSLKGEGSNDDVKCKNSAKRHNVHLSDEIFSFQVLPSVLGGQPDPRRLGRGALHLPQPGRDPHRRRPDRLHRPGGVVRPPRRRLVFLKQFQRYEAFYLWANDNTLPRPKFSNSS